MKGRTRGLVLPWTAAPTGLEAYERLTRRLERGDARDGAGLAELAVSVWTRPGFDALVSPPRLRFEPFPYQLRAAQAALRRMRGRAILADEVGLGKTIEACLVLSELRLRGLADRAIVLAPAGLVEQWREELDRKFAIPSTVVQGGAWEPTLWQGESPVLIASLAAARRAPLRDAIVAPSWDLAIVDEAHHLKNPRGASAALVKALRTRHLLLLTATPVENRLDDLFQLVSLVRPGHLGSLKEFRARHAGAQGPWSAKDVSTLQSRMRDIMVRHRRSEVAQMLPRRLAETRQVEPAPDEAALYRVVSERVRRQGRGAGPAETLTLRTVQRLAGSSPQALVPSLDKIGWRDLANQAAAITATQKSNALRALLRRQVENGEKTVVFTAFRQTLGFLARQLAADALPAVSYHGSLGRREKEACVRAFAAEVPIMLTTEAAGEGRNLQFCHTMVNFDLPWNPMRIEQRLGRIHRIGQESDVLVVNLVSRETIEERVLDVLERKINLFELVVGELDMILGRVSEDFDFEESVFVAHVASEDDGELSTRLDDLGDELARAREAYLESRGATDRLVGDPHPT